MRLLISFWRERWSGWGCWILKRTLDQNELKRGLQMIAGLLYTNLGICGLQIALPPLTFLSRFFYFGLTHIRRQNLELRSWPRSSICRTRKFCATESVDWKSFEIFKFHKAPKFWPGRTIVRCKSKRQILENMIERDFKEMAWCHQGHHRIFFWWK